MEESTVSETGENVNVIVRTILIHIFISLQLSIMTLFFQNSKLSILLQAFEVHDTALIMKDQMFDHMDFVS
jgi:hypothetical protein